ncbi:hypothetical protein [Beijerinckia mobilis]|uniref:hypothetical protein n=1 Tax=Beijerinckia mobilis TaxID=231434 RepID=UPI00054EA4A9|nr:hypothetical protein [Beijerinckia mobilis]
MPAVRKRPEARTDFIKKNPRFLAVRKGILDGSFDQQEPWEDRLVTIEYFSWLLPLALASIFVRLLSICRLARSQQRIIRPEEIRIARPAFTSFLIDQRARHSTGFGVIFFDAANGAG